jgi:hypothetical protein
MVRRRPPRVESPTEQDVRDQEVLRANKELAAYFKGLRTEREARGSLKIIKAFIRSRERQDPKSRPPLPGSARRATKAGMPEKVRKSETRKRRTKRPRIRATPSAEPSPQEVATTIPSSDSPSTTEE